MLSFCDDACTRAYAYATLPAAEGPKPLATDHCAACVTPLRPTAPAWTPESHALLVELARVVRNTGPALERAVRQLDRDAVHALRFAVRDIEWERSSLRSKAARLGLRGSL